MSASDQPPAPGNRFSRRRLLTAGAALGGAAAISSIVGYEAAIRTSSTPTAETPAPDTQVPFYGTNQAGIATPAQDRLAFAAFDVTSTNRDDLTAMLRAWTDAAQRMSEGLQVGDVTDSPLAPPIDTGEALGLLPTRLTITIGFGPTMFDGRFGLAASRPAALIDLPDLPGDYLDPAFTGGDLAIQACADDPQVAFHALRNLARLGRGTAVMRWSELGFGRTSSTSSSQVTPRNLMGFKDGTNNVLGDDLAAMSQFVWVGDETDQAWMKNGSYMVARRVRMLIEAWDRDYLADQQNVFGRFKDTGAPLTGTNERDTVNLTAVTAAGQPVIPMDAHIRLAAPASNGGYRILRRGYSFTDGIDPLTGELDAGLFFIAFQKDPRLQFVPLQRQLGSHDALNEYIKHTGSGIFACPPGVATGGWWGQSLFG